jgi:hypothetical protein
MRWLRVVGLSLAATLLLGSAQAGAAKPQPDKVKQTAYPIWTLAIDGPRVAYASAGRIYVWNVATGATSVVRGIYSGGLSQCSGMTPDGREPRRRLRVGRRRFA